MGSGHRQRRGVIALSVVRAWVGILLAGVLLAWGPGALALDPALEVSQYAHTAWKIRDGFSKGAVTSIAQTPDGYLWLGTELGLLRFDGVRAVPWQPPAGEQLPSNHISRLVTARDGTLWIGTMKGLASWKDGKLTQYPEVAGQLILSLLQDHDGTVWFGLFNPAGLCAIQNGRVKCDRAANLDRVVSALYEDREGNLWASDINGLWRWAPGPPEHYVVPGGVVETNSILEDDNGALLLATNAGLKQLVDGRIQSYALPGVTGRFRPNLLFRSSDGSLWVGTQQGLLHLHQGRVDEFAAIDGLSADYVGCIFEDHEGNVWVSTQGGLDRFRDVAVPTISRNQGLSNSTVWPVQATPDGSIWLGTPGGLNRWQNGHVSVYERRAPGQNGSKRSGRAQHQRNDNGNREQLTGTPRSLGLDDRGRLWASTSEGVSYFDGGRFVRIPGVPGGNIFSITADGQGNVWILNGDLGLFYLTHDGAVQKIPWPRPTQNYWGVLLPDRLQGGLWLGFSEGGIAYLKDGQVRASYTAAEGLGDGSVIQLRFGSRGSLWAATEGGLSRIRNGKIATLTSKNGLPCDTVHWSMEDDDHAVWLYMPCGLVRIARSELDAWVSDSKRTVQVTSFDNSDGVTSVGHYGGYGPHVTKSPDGKLWFATFDGVSVIDPRHLPVNKVPPPVHIEHVTADRKTYWQNLSGDASSSRPRLPPLVRDVMIDYTALSFVAPEKVLFRYKLEGRDRDWQDAGNRRQAFYTNLSPGNYRFRVAACNNSGVWNEAGTFLDFSVAPAYYQTNWFRVTCVAAFLGMLWGLYQLRLHQVARQFNMRLEERVNERTRIARELHDTLLQNLHGLLFRFQAARNMLPRRTEEAMEALDGAISRTEQAISESRDTIKDLRYERVTSTDLAELLTQTGRELESGADANGNPPIFRVIVEGERQTLSPVLQDEVYRIARELLRNAFQHARARHIEAEIRYDHHLLRVLIRDDGKGMDANVLKEGGQPGHWGLPGVRERAKQIGARLDFWSEAGAGTEVQLTVPVSVDSEKPRDGSKFRLFSK
jgi:signal transduction histidine kinase/ligand-binding sensor domain-containing protein